MSAARLGLGVNSGRCRYWSVLILSRIQQRQGHGVVQEDGATSKSSLHVLLAYVGLSFRVKNRLRRDVEAVRRRSTIKRFEFRVLMLSIVSAAE